MEIITNPWKSKFLDLVSKSKSSIKITSPFVKENVCNEMLSVKNDNVKLELVTSFKIGNIHSGSLDLNALNNILDSKGIIKNYTKLHAKIYLFDNKEVIISSANLTNGGLIDNYEYGVYSKDKTLVNKVINDFEDILNDEKTGNIEKKHITEVNKIILGLPQKQIINIPKFKIDEHDEELILDNSSKKVINDNLKGWKLDVFNCVNEIDKEIFSLKDVYQFEEKMKNLHPKNTKITDKMRQQLQNLRDIGLIEFLGNGIYRKLWI